MWFVEVEPERTGAASVSVGILGDEFVLSLPNSHWEIWRSKRGPDPLVLLSEEIETVFDGRVEEVAGATIGPFDSLSPMDGLEASAR